MRTAYVVAAAVACTQLGGCFFVFIPGSVMAKASDAVTGASGEHCVGRGAKVGDKIVMADGKLGTVQKLSGESMGCSNASMPIRAAVAVDS